ncbi:MAG TPA: hypothetical protein VGI54_11745, partial [Solirubrobacteraceae bacterium]
LIIAATVPVGVGMGVFVPPLINLVLRTVPPASAGAASGTLVTGQQLGNALGVALVGTVFFSELGSRTGLAAYGDAFAAAAALQALLAATSAVLVHRARGHQTGTGRVTTPAVERAS